MLRREFGLVCSIDGMNITDISIEGMCTIA